MATMLILRWLPWSANGSEQKCFRLHYILFFVWFSEKWLPNQKNIPDLMLRKIRSSSTYSTRWMEASLQSLSGTGTAARTCRSTRPGQSSLQPSIMPLDPPIPNDSCRTTMQRRGRRHLLAIRTRMTLISAGSGRTVLSLVEVPPPQRLCQVRGTGILCDIELLPYRYFS